MLAFVVVVQTFYPGIIRTQQNIVVDVCIPKPS